MNPPVRTALGLVMRRSSVRIRQGAPWETPGQGSDLGFLVVVDLGIRADRASLGYASQCVGQGLTASGRLRWQGYVLAFFAPCCRSARVCRVRRGGHAVAERAAVVRMEPDLPCGCERAWGRKVVASGQSRDQRAPHGVSKWTVGRDRDGRVVAVAADVREGAEGGDYAGWPLLRAPCRCACARLPRCPEHLDFRECGRVRLGQRRG